MVGQPLLWWATMVVYVASPLVGSHGSAASPLVGSHGRAASPLVGNHGSVCSLSFGGQPW